eukprot:Hpha_TRINITY_DN12024_c0_g1::TRINITY_DN12024_c0_g1_i1::g.141225::m.141225
MHVECSNKGIVELDLRSLYASEEERGALAAVKSLDLSRNELAQLSGLQPFSALARLDLSNNRLVLLRGLPLSVVRLNVANNNLSSLEGLATLANLQELDASCNKLTDLRGLPRRCPLSKLNVNGNRLRTTIGLDSCTHLRVLDIEQNYLCRLSDLEPLRSCAKLRQLALASNPLSEDGTYNRAAVAQLLPSLSVLDGAELSRKAQSPPSALRQPLRISSTAETGRTTPPSQTRSGRPVSAPRSRYRASSPTSTQQQRPPSPHITPGTTAQYRSPRAAMSSAVRQTHRSQSPGHLEEGEILSAHTPVTKGAQGTASGTHDLSFDSLRTRAEFRRGELAQSNQRLDVSVKELKQLLEQEYKHNSSLQRERKQLSAELAATKQALSEELNVLESVRGENSRLSAELAAQRERSDCLASDCRVLQDKLREERRRRVEDLGRVKEGHQVVMQALQQQAKEGQEKADETRSAAERWQDERVVLLERMRELENRNTELSVQLSKHENVSADLPHLSQRVQGVGSGIGGLTLTWHPSGGHKSPSGGNPEHPPSPLSLVDERGDRQGGGQQVWKRSAEEESPPPPRAPAEQHAGVVDALQLIQMSRSANAAAAAGETLGADVEQMLSPPGAARSGTAPLSAAPPPPQHDQRADQRVEAEHQRSDFQQVDNQRVDSQRTVDYLRSDFQQVDHQRVDYQRTVDQQRSHQRVDGTQRADQSVSQHQPTPLEHEQQQLLLEQAQRYHALQQQHAGRQQDRADEQARDGRGRLSPYRSSRSVSPHPRDQPEGTRNAIEFAVKLKQWLLSEMQKGAAAVNGEALNAALGAADAEASRFKAQLFQSQVQPRPKGPPRSEQSRTRYAAVSRISSPPPPLPVTSPPPPAPSPPPATGGAPLEALWSRNASLI